MFSSYNLLFLTIGEDREIDPQRSCEDTIQQRNKNRAGFDMKMINTFLFNFSRVAQSMRLSSLDSKIMVVFLIIFLNYFSFQPLNLLDP
jgi:hypothetical protein